MRNQSIDSKLLFAQNAISNAEIKAVLVLFAYDDVRVEEGEALCTKAADLQTRQKKEYGEQYAATDALNLAKATANGEAGDDANAKEKRDKAYTWMKLAVDEIRTVGQYVFYQDEDRKKGYISQYLKRVRDRYNSSKNAADSLEV